MGAVRVLRLLEYTYESWEAAEKDQVHWGVPPNGRRDGGVRMVDEPYGKSSKVTIRSSVLITPLAEETEPTRPDNLAAADGEQDGNDEDNPAV